ncbi:YggS family pyridoxal phosphate-dependent enzyme [Bifidobacterium vespertilionis]|uniref:Pyridoxal phosphate homeostasis protein n=1 Tax=Bifidobacterium vespertilionis TaxID=2562524 RepID=A0A5J5DW98_9BIFI|nr:YggS family pyridoxal phosphate-dependent enzyme [Bifidobacterium vespertilionis]KAA8820107.1 YggS family pyridoxal phosphate-dependent enzyme [Bifidobacterium vespertilionis]KAA8820932.1 YggS family pyridoxal phosphate-dependent enzyme [Bifidobacterium vespertilionis]
MTAYMDHKDLANETIDGTRARQIADGVHRVLDGIARAEDSAGRKPGEVRLLAATKTRDVGEIMAAIDAGVRMIGENRPQEVEVKSAGLARLCAERGFALGATGSVAGASVAEAAPVTGQAAPATGSAGLAGAAEAALSPLPFHLIGQLQSNKINKVLPSVTTIESVDSLALAEKIARRAVARGITVGVLLEVNESGEESKSGCDPEAALDIAASVAALEGLELQGLMTIGAHVDDEATIRRGFAHLRATRDAVLASGAPGTASCRELSMGMTNDMALAIAEGSTIVRVGTAIFGPRAFI